MLSWAFNATFNSKFIMRKSSSLYYCFILGLAGKAQTAEDSVKAVINKMFTAMKQCDSAMLSDFFASSGILQSVQVKDGRSQFSMKL